MNCFLLLGNLLFGRDEIHQIIMVQHDIYVLAIECHAQETMGSTGCGQGGS